MGTGYPKQHDYVWTAEKIKELRAFYMTHTLDETANHFGASPQAVDFALRRNGIRKQQRELFLSDRPAPRKKSKSGSGVIAPRAYATGYRWWSA